MGYRFPALALALLGVASPEAALVRAIHDYDGESADPPRLLSQTGLFDRTGDRARMVTSGIHAYSVNSPLWSDGSAKERYVALPAGTRITPTDSDGYVFPDKTVMIKTFAIDTVYGDSTTRVLVETRFMVRRAMLDAFGRPVERHLGFTYAWERDQGDAVLVPPDSARLEVARTVRVGGRLLGKRWQFPSRSDCAACHSGRRRYLGFFTQQLDRAMGATDSQNQLQSLFDKGVLDRNPVAGKTGSHRWYGLGEIDGTQEQKVRSYFASNCSHCHGNGNLTALHVLDYLDPARDIRYYEDDPERNPGGWVGKRAGSGKLIAPGRPDSSYFLEKMLTRPAFLGLIGAESMPPLATFQIDSAAVDAIRRWVCGIGKVDPDGGGCRLPEGTADADTWALSVRRGPGPRGLRVFSAWHGEFMAGGIHYREGAGTGPGTGFGEPVDARGRRAPAPLAPER